MRCQRSTGITTVVPDCGPVSQFRNEQPCGKGILQHSEVLWAPLTRHLKKFAERVARDNRAVPIDQIHYRVCDRDGARLDVGGLCGLLDCRKIVYPDG